MRHHELDWREVPSVQSEFRVKKSDDLVLEDLLACATMMNDRRFRSDDRPSAQLSHGTHAKIRLFAVHEELGIKSSKLLPGSAIDEKQAPRDHSDFPNGVSLPTAIRARIKHRRTRKHRPQSNACREDRPKGIRAPTTPGIERTIFKDRSASPDSVLRMGVCKVNKRVQRAIKDHGVRIQQEQVPPASNLGQSVVALQQTQGSQYSSQG